MFFDPRDPSQASLLRRPSWVKGLWILGGLIFGVGGFFWAKAVVED